MQLDPHFITAQIATLRLMYPELAEDEEAWALSVESETDAIELLRAVERKRQEAETYAGAIAANFVALEIRHSRFVRREKAMRDLAFRILQAADLKRAELPEATLSLANGVQRVVITDEAILPDLLCKITRTPDKAKIKELLKTGAEVRGAVLSNSEPHLMVKTR